MIQKKIKKITGRTRIRTGVVRIKTESDNHYTIQPLYERVMDETSQAVGLVK